jgi:hypothetical protein
MTGLSAEDQLNFEKARSLGAQQSQQGAQAALQNAAARGVGGSGLEFGMREQANQEAANRAQTAGLEQAERRLRASGCFTIRRMGRSSATCARTGSPGERL